MRRLLALALALFSAANAARTILALQQAIQLPDLPSSPPPAYLAAMGVIWAVVFGACAVGIAQSRRWAPRVTIAAIVLYQANLWFNHAAFTRSPEAEARVGFAALLSVASIVVIGAAALWCERRFAARGADAQS
jgi:hypothetical protein